MLNPLISIIIPVYNCEKYLSETLTSAINQTWQNKEIIVVDDGSTDSSLQIAKSFASPAVQIITQQKKGASAARNNGLKFAKGQYIQFLDADDILALNKIETQVWLLSTKPGYVSLCSTIHFLDGNNYQLALPQLDFTATATSDPVTFLVNLYGGNPNYPDGGMIQPNAWLTPRKIIDQAGLWNENLSIDDDGEFFCRIILVSKGIAYATETFNYYRKYQHKNNLSAQLNLPGFQSMLKSIDLKKQHLTESYNPEFVKQIFARHYWSVALIAYPRFKTLSAQAAKKAKEGNYNGRKYKGGPVSNVLSLILGWRVLRYIGFIRYGF